jgi:hypothetical protein
MRQNKPIGEVQNYAYIHYWLGKAHGKANKCESPDCPGTSKRFEWAKLRDRPYAKYRENFWQLCKHCHMLYDGAKAWNKGIRAKDHPRLQAALDKAHAAVRGSVAWNRQIAAVACDNCGGSTLKRPSDRTHSRTGKLFCGKPCMYQSLREHFARLRENANIQT